MRTFGSNIVKRENYASCKLSLHPKVPLVDAAVNRIRVYRSQSCIDGINRSGIEREVKAAVETDVVRRRAGAACCNDIINKEGQVERQLILAASPLKAHIESAITSSHNRLWCQLIRQTNSRRKVILIRLHQAPAKLRISGSKLLPGREVQIRHSILPLIRPSCIVVAQAEIDSQLGSDLPVVLEKQ